MGEKWIGTAVYLCSRLPQGRQGLQGDSLSENGANDDSSHISDSSDNGNDNGSEDRHNDAADSLGSQMDNHVVGSHNVPAHVTKHGGVILPLKPLQRKNESLCLGPLRRLCERYRVEKIIVGLPKAHDGAWRYKNDARVDVHTAWGGGDLTWEHENFLGTSPSAQSQGSSARRGAFQRSQRHPPGMRAKVKAYVKRLTHHFDHLQIGMVDEAYTTWTVQERFPGVGKHAGAEGIDSLSAVCIVQAYLHESTE